MLSRQPGRNCNWCRFHRLGAAAGLVAVLFAWLGNAPLSVSAITPCDFANALRSVHQMDEAVGAYVRVLRDNPAEPCALNALTELAAEAAQTQATNAREAAVQQVMLARMYEAAAATIEASDRSQANALRERARDAYIEALAADPAYQAAIDGLANVLAPLTSDRIAVAQAMKDAGFNDEATIELKNELRANPDAVIPDGLSTSLRRQWVPWWNPPWELLAKILLPLAVTLLLLAALLLRLPWFPRRRKPQLSVEDFNVGSTNLTIGKEMAALAEQAYLEFNLQHGILATGVVRGPIEQLPIPAEIAALSPSVNIVARLFGWLFPRHVITLTGHLHVPSESGVGVTAALVSGSTLIDSITIRESAFTPWGIDRSHDRTITALPYYRLARAVGVWARFRLVEER